MDAKDQTTTGERIVSEPGPAGDRPRGVRMAALGSTTSHEELCAFIQARLSLLARIMFWVFWVLFALVGGMYQIWPHVRPERVEVYLYFAVGALVLSAVVWAVALRRPGASLRTLYAIDVLYLFLAGATFGVSAYFQSDLEVAIYAALISHLIVVFARAIIMPSSGLRTAAVSTLSFLPLFAGALGVAATTPERLELPPVAFTIGGLFYAAVTVLIAATGSRIIYGLGREVRAAMQLGKYTLVERIQGGGMGEVYRAQHELLRRPTAVKLVAPSKVGVESLRRFEREVQTTSLLSHPNTVAIYDYGRSPDGVFYYAMEYLDGTNLDDLVRQYGPQPAPRVVHVLVQICGALDEAHSVGLIHRDIKPANVILCERGRQPDVAKVVDFGLVKEIAAEAETDGLTTRAVMGTPTYISPEAVTDPDAVGPASDLYSLGATAYFLLTGQHVFDGKTSLETCVRHVSATPVPPSQRTSNPIPAGLEALVLSCLRKDPAARPKSALDLRMALLALPAHRDWDEAAAREWWREFHAARASATPTAAPAPAVVRTVTMDTRDRTEPLDALEPA